MNSPARRLLSLAKPHWRALAFGTVSLLISSGIGLLYPQAARLTIDEVIEQGGAGGFDLQTIGLGLLLLFLIQAVFVALRSYLFTVTGDRIVTDLRAALYDSILAQEMGFFDATRTGELTSRLASDTQVIQSAVTVNLSMLLRYGAQAVGGIGLLVYTSAKLSIALVVLLPVVLGTAIVYGRKVRRLSRQVQDAIAASTSVAEESVAGIRTVRSFAREPEERARYGRAIEESFLLARRRSLLGALFGGSMSFLAYGAIAVVLWLGSAMVLEGTLSVGDLTAFILYTLMVAVSLGILSGLYGDLMKAVGASERVFGLLDRVPELATAPDARVRPARRGALSLRDVRFRYPTRPEVWALAGVSFELEPGTQLALVGPSGSGKSTVAALIQRFYDPDEGAILIDNTDARRWDLAALRSSIGLVAQEPVLFSGTIAENVRFGRPGASDEQVRGALEAANALSFVSTFPDGLGTVIGERGVRLSGGQKQRIAIARALLKDPALLVLDEATSALDAESEAVVGAALERLMRDRTTLVIAHRLSTIRGADRVAVLDKGRIVEYGPHAELMAREGLYARLVKSQQFAD